MLDTWFSSALWPFATLGWPDETAAAARVLPDDGALDRARHPLPVGRADDHDGPALHRGGPVRGRLHPLGDPGARRAAHVEVARHRHRPARRDRPPRRRRGALRAARDVLLAGRALLRREGPAGPGARQQALQRDALRAVADPRRSAMSRSSRSRPRRARAHRRGSLDPLAPAASQARDGATRIERYDFSHAALGLYDFVYGELCDWYLEIVKPRLASDPASSRARRWRMASKAAPPTPRPGSAPGPERARRSPPRCCTSCARRSRSRTP